MVKEVGPDIPCMSLVFLACERDEIHHLFLVSSVFSICSFHQRSLSFGSCILLRMM